MKYAAKILSLAVLFVLSVSSFDEAKAHHSGALYDRSSQLTIEGTVKEFQWTNPHVVLWLTFVPEGAVDPQVWAFQATSPGNLGRMGWSHRSLKPGDKIKLEAYPLRDKAPGGAIRTVTILETGEVLKFESLSSQLEPNRTGKD